jgi:deoxyribose-phosphate aldolase
MKPSLEEIAKCIDHAVLQPTLTDKELREGCQVALRSKTATVCIKPYAVAMASEILRGSDVRVCTVVGFPHGISRMEIKDREAELAWQDGATEIDMVVNVGKVISEDWKYVEEEIRLLQETVTKRKSLLKVIFETDFLPQDALKIRLCEICSHIGVAFVKTSTGFGFVKQANGMYAYTGATEHDITLMRKACASAVQIKASGGIRTLDDVLKMRGWGATRIGATATEAILAEARKRGYQ